MAPSVDATVLLTAGSLWLAAALAVGVSAVSSPAPAKPLPPPRWSSANAAKRWTENFFIFSSPVWVAFMAVVVIFKLYEKFDERIWMAVGCIIIAPCIIGPLLFQPASERALPFAQRHWVRAHVWLGAVVYVGSYFWTHYFFTLLGAKYTFAAHTLNGVPIAMYFAAHAYFCLYHSMTNCALRRWYTSHVYARLSPGMRTLGTWTLVAAMSWVTAFMEGWTIQGFPGYHITDRASFQTVGSIVYGIYFIVTFPMYYRLGSEEHTTTTTNTTSSSSSGSVAADAAPAAVVDSDPADTPRSGAGSNRGGNRARSPARTKQVPDAAAPAAASATPASATGDASAGEGVVVSPLATAGTGDWSLATSLIDGLGAAMAVTIMLDLWRIGYIAAKVYVEGPGSIPEWQRQAAGGMLVWTQPQQ